MELKATKRFCVSGICCSTEEMVLRDKLDKLFGKDGYSFNSLTNEISISAEADDSKMREELSRVGFALKESAEIVDDPTLMERHGEAMVTGLAAVLALVGILLEHMSGPDLLSRVILLASIVAGGWKVFQRAFRALRSFSLDMNFLMAMAVIGAIGIDKWGEGAAVIVLFGLSLVLESYSTRRTRRAVHALMSNAPDEAMVVNDGKETVVPSKEVRPGQVLAIRPGGRIPLDGIVIEGESGVNQAAITGESTLVTKEPGMEVFAGSINDRGFLHVRVTKRFNDTVLSRIIDLVEKSQEKRAQVQTFVERFARIYTPAVFGLALMIAVVPPLVFSGTFSDWFYRALVLLVIACPCALVISTPVTIVSALTAAARRGILIKGGRQLETLSQVRAIAFDKTGTLTSGSPRITDIIPLNSHPRGETLRMAAALERRSEHHLASAILASAEREGVSYRDVDVAEFEAVPGMGIKGKIEGKTFYLGNGRFSTELGLLTDEVRELLIRLAEEGKTALVFGTEEQPIAVLAARDAARHGSAAAIKNLRNHGIREIVLLSGDGEMAVRTVANEVGITNAAASKLPEEKVAVVEALAKKYGPVAMVGDGINDAPALAASSVGISMGVSGTDAALETSDVVLMSDDIGKLPSLIGLSQKAMSVVKQNIALALTVKGLFLLLSVSGVATLWMAVLADDGTALAVILNGLRLLSDKNAG